jgi:hypothetical protein
LYTNPGTAAGIEPEAHVFINLPRVGVGHYLRVIERLGCRLRQCSGMSLAQLVAAPTETESHRRGAVPYAEHKR